MWKLWEIFLKMKTIKTNISADKSLELIESLQEWPGAIHSDFGVGFLLDDGNFLKFVATEDGEGKLFVKLIEKDS